MIQYVSVGVSTNKESRSFVRGDNNDIVKFSRDAGPNIAKYENQLFLVSLSTSLMLYGRGGVLKNTPKCGFGIKHRGDKIQSSR